MNIFTDILFLFVYLFALLYFKIPDVANNNYLIHKFFLFIAIFGYYYVIHIIKKIKYGCKIDPYQILTESLNMSLFCILGYSIYVDMMYMDSTKSYFGDITQVNLNKRFLAISIIMTGFVTLVHLVKTLFKSDGKYCE